MGPFKAVDLFAAVSRRRTDVPRNAVRVRFVPLSVEVSCFAPPRTLFFYSKQTYVLRLLTYFSNSSDTSNAKLIDIDAILNFCSFIYFNCTSFTAKRMSKQQEKKHLQGCNFQRLGQLSLSGIIFALNTPNKKSQSAKLYGNITKKSGHHNTPEVLMRKTQTCHVKYT